MACFSYLHVNTIDDRRKSRKLSDTALGILIHRESLRKSPMTKLPTTEFQESDSHNVINLSRNVCNKQPPKRQCSTKQYGPKEIEIILNGASKKLQLVERQRYIMKLQARIDVCQKGMDLADIENIEWYDFSKCPTKYHTEFN